jgi:hypothetical protein
MGAGLATALRIIRNERSISAAFRQWAGIKLRLCNSFEDGKGMSEHFEDMQSIAAGGFLRRLAT